MRQDDITLALKELKYGVGV